jgi:hypothetical protein
MEVLCMYVFVLEFRTGLDVMITIFCDFANYRRKYWRFFSKTNAMTTILHN